MPSESQMQAMMDLYGYDERAVQGLVQTAQLAAAAGYRSGGGGRSSGSGTNSNVTANAGTSYTDLSPSEIAFYEKAAKYGENADDYIKKNWKETGLFNSQTAAVSGYEVFLKDRGMWTDGQAGDNSAYYGTGMTYSRLGPAARDIYDRISGIYQNSKRGDSSAYWSANGVSNTADAIKAIAAEIEQKTGKKNGITEPEAEFLLNAIGY